MAVTKVEAALQKIQLLLEQIKADQGLTHDLILKQDVSSHTKFDLNEANRSKFTIVQGSRSGDLFSFTRDKIIIDIPVNFGFIDKWKIDKITLPQGSFSNWTVDVYVYKGGQKHQLEESTNGWGYLNTDSFGNFDMGTSVPNNLKENITKFRIEMEAVNTASARLKIEGFEVFEHHTQDITKGRPPYAQLADEDKNMLREALANAKNGANNISRTIPFNKD